MSLRALFHRVLRFEWLGEADATVDRLVRTAAPKVLRRRLWLAAVGGVALLFLVPFSLFALPPHLSPFVLPLPPNPSPHDVLFEHLALEDAELVVLQGHELRDLSEPANNPPGLRDVNVPGRVSKQKLQQLNLQQLRNLQIHQVQLLTQFANPDSLILPPSLLPLQVTLQQQELQELLRQQRNELRLARLKHHSKRYIQALRQRQLIEFLTLVRHFQDLDHRATAQGTPFALRDLDAFDPLVLDFYPHPPGAKLDLDNDYDTMDALEND